MREPKLNTSPSPGDEVKTTTCYMCACRCGIKVWLQDGRIRYIQGNPEHPVNHGVLCAKGSAGIMQHYSPARLSKPLLRVGERGKGEFKEIEWDEALQIATDWLAPIRERNPDELAFFTGRDQSQALTGWWAQQFGTINYAAHGGFCSVNMAAGGLYTLGGSFWEFGEPDWEHTQYLMLWGLAEDHDSNPIKLGLGKLKARGAKIVAVNPVRSGYGAIADEWIGIRPGTDGLFAFALIHELLRSDRIDLDYLVSYANAHWLVIKNPGGADDGLFARDEEGNPLCWAFTPPLSRSEGGGWEGVAVDPDPHATSKSTPPQPSPADAREGATARADAFTPPLSRSEGGGREGVAVDPDPHATSKSTPPQPSPADAREGATARADAFAPPLSRSEGGGWEGVAVDPDPHATSKSTPPQPSPADAREGATARADAFTPPLSRSEGGGREGVAVDPDSHATSKSTPPQPSPADAREGATARADAFTPPLSRSEGGGWEGVAVDLDSHARSKSTPPQPSPSLREREGATARADAIDISPAVVGEYTLPDGRKAVPVFQLIAERYLDEQYAPDNVSERCGIPADTIRRIARELAAAAFDSKLTLPIAWTDSWGRKHDEMVGRPVSMHAMRGISAHSNGFHTCRALHLLQLLLGAIDAPGSFRYQPPYPKPIPLPNRPGKTRKENGALDGGPLGYVHGPEDLLVDADGNPRRIDHAFSWAYPLSAHGMMHTVIRNAWAGSVAGDSRYKIDTLMMFMANMGWNSSMNTTQTMHWLTDKDADGNYRIPHIIYSDAYASETVAYADLVLPDTTYLERFDAISMLDRPIGDADGAADAIRQPVFAPETQDVEGKPRDVRGFQSVLLDLGARLALPGMVDADGAPVYKDYADYIVNHERAPGVGLLAGWRGADGTQSGKGAPNPAQLDAYIANGCYWREEMPESARYYKMANRDYLQWAQGLGMIGNTDPIVLQLYSEPLQKFRLAAQGHGAIQPPERDRKRVATYFDPLPLWYEPFEHEQTSAAQYTLNAITQRPMFMYHAWGSQNAWLRQITARNYLYLHPDTGAAHGIHDEDWIDVSSHNGSLRVQAKFASNVEPGTVWSWNAIGKRKRAWRLAADAPEAEKGFLLNHLICDLTPRGDYSNSDPVTGQAAWFDLRVSIAPAGAHNGDPAISQPQFEPLAFSEADDRPLRYGARMRASRD